MKFGLVAREDSPIGQNGDPPSRVVIDLNRLKSLIGDDETLVRELLHDFRTSTAQIANALIAAGTAGQIAKTAELAHKLKSSSHMVGALTLSRLCAALELAGKTGDGGAQATLLPEFERELASVEDFLDRY